MARNVLQTINEMLKDSPKSEQKIGQLVLERPKDIIQMNATELAKEAKSSPAGVIRFCRSIGISGFTALKLALSAQTSQRGDLNYTDIDANEGLDTIKEKLATNASVVFADTNVSLLNQDIDQVTDWIMASPVVFLYGLGASNIVAQDFRQKFTRIGKQVMVTQDQHELVAAMAIAPKDSLYIGISNSGEKAEGTRVIKMAKELGLKTVSLTKAGANTLANLADIPLHTADTKEALLRSGATISLLAQLYAIDLLFFSYMTKNYDTHVQNLAISKEATNAIDSFYQD